MQTTNQYSAAALAEICLRKGVQHVVISPGSRNAPLTIAFNRQEKITCISIPDERSAGFFALGMAQELNRPVALLCTSGSALLNYAPAAAEAFYQFVPLLFISADRPVEWIDQGVGQTIRQVGALEPHVKRTIQLPQDPEHKDDKWFCDRLINEGIDSLTHDVPGPVHVNVPLREPLYGTEKFDATTIHTIDQVSTRSTLSSLDLDELSAAFNRAQKVMIMAGQHAPGDALQPLLEKLATDYDVVVLTESTSNLDGGPFHGCIDRLLPGTNPQEHAPDLLISFGGPIISKRIIHQLRDWPVKAHWRVGLAPRHLDTFQHLSKDIQSNPEDLFEQLLERIETKPKTYSSAWQNLESDSLAKHHSFLSSAPFCDLTVFEKLLALIPADSDIHWANSTPIRYSQLFVRNRKHAHYANRGTSGIDGCTSTASGFAYASQRLTTLVTGDVAFLYDTNGLWNHHLSKQLKIVLIDNGGGNIFKYIPGPDSTAELEEFFVTKSKIDALEVAKAYGLEVFDCSNGADLESALSALYASAGTAVLRVQTNPELSPKVLRDYFNHLANG